VSGVLQIIQLLPKDRIRKLIRDSKSDHASKGFDTWTHLVSMIFCQCKSTISYQNSHRDHNVFGGIFDILVDHFAPQFRRKKKPKIKLKRKIYALDSTVIPLCL